ncbi:MAG: 1,3-1,4-beta-glycanase, partial [Mesorhizobium sp.]
MLIGGGGADTFIITKGHGSDLITDFGADDSIRLNGYDFMSFDAVKANMIQVGTNVALMLGSGEELV